MAHVLFAHMFLLAPLASSSSLELQENYQVAKNPFASARDVETQVRSLAWEDPLEEGMATHSSILAWRIPWTEEPGVLQSMGLHSQTRLKRLSTQAHINSISTNISCWLPRLWLGSMGNTEH